MKKRWAGGLFFGALAVAGVSVAQGPQTLLPSTVDTIFVGDIMLDRLVAKRVDTVGSKVLFAGVEELLEGHDAVVGNLEGAITDNPSISQASSSILRFTFVPEMAQVLRDAGFDALSLANNHSLDFGRVGYEQTVSYLTAEEITPFGSPLNNQNILAQLPIKGKNFCLVGYHGLFDPNPTSVIKTIEGARSTCTYVVLVAHWGEEYSHDPTGAQQSLAHKFIDAGADVVIGAHPHVVEPLEIYKDKAIFYSLGNFVFDQGWRPEVKRGLAVGIEFVGNKTHFTLVATESYKEARVAGATTTRAVLADLVTPDLPKNIKNSILNKGEFELKN